MYTQQQQQIVCVVFSSLLERKKENKERITKMSINNGKYKRETSRMIR